VGAAAAASALDYFRSPITFTSVGFLRQFRRFVAATEGLQRGLRGLTKIYSTILKWQCRSP
jgi:hypothetical protein